MTVIRYSESTAAAARQALKKLLGFAAIEDIEDVERADLRRIQRDVATIAASAGRYDSRHRRVTISGWRWMESIEQDLPWSRDERKLRKTIKTLLDLQRMLYDHRPKALRTPGLLQLLFPPAGMGQSPGVSARVPATTSAVHLQRHNSGPASGVQLWFDVEDWRSAFWLAVSALLEEYGDRIRKCPRARCRAYFLKVGRQLHCSGACANAERQRAWRERHGVSASPARKRHGKKKR